MNYKPTRQDFEKFLKDTNQTDKPLEEAHKKSLIE